MRRMQKYPGLKTERQHLAFSSSYPPKIMFSSLQNVNSILQISSPGRQEKNGILSGGKIKKAVRGNSRPIYKSDAL
jgi:hypothetical protein